jgi:3',5'-cyclic AMP phosphodiesterase CpdA
VPPFFHLFHVSDLHFGDPFHPTVQRMLQWIPFPMGVEVHHMEAVRELHASILVEGAAVAPTPCALCVTGDLTTLGRQGAFESALHFIGVRPSSVSFPYRLNQSTLSFIPGNHDIWGGFMLGVGGKEQYVRNTYFHHPVPPEPQKTGFPYQVLLSPGPPAIYLYGLDSTRVDAQGSPVTISWRNVRALGFIDDLQFTALENLVRSESRNVPSLRIAAIHHPVAYPTTVRTGVAGFQKELTNLDLVLDRLQRLGFAIVLCGHQHKGFTQSASVANCPHPPLWALSVGTATQVIPAVSSEKNEYRIYDFTAVPGTGYQIVVGVRSFELTGLNKHRLPRFVLNRKKSFERHLNLYSHANP